MKKKLSKAYGISNAWPLGVGQAGDGLTNGKSVGFTVPGLAAYSVAGRATLLGQSDTTILLLGDSTTAGVGVSTSNLKGSSYPTQLAALMEAAGYHTSLASVCGGAGLDQSYTVAAIDPRITLGDWIWQTNASFHFIGGAPYRANAATTNPLAYAEPTLTDYCHVFYPKISGGPSISIDANGGTPTVVSTAGTGWGKVTITAPLGVNTYNVQSQGGAVAQVGMFIAGNSAEKKFNIINCGRSGAQSGFLATTVSPAALIALIDPDLIIYMDGINDWYNSVGTSTFSTNVQTNITSYFQPSGADVLLMPGLATNSATYSDAVQNGYRDAMSALSTGGVQYLDANGGLTYAQRLAAGYKAADLVHETATGYANVAARVKARITP